MKDKKEKPSEHAGPVTGDPSKRDLFNNEWQNTEVNLNHLDLEADRNRINSLKAAYINQYVIMHMFVILSSFIVDIGWCLFDMEIAGVEKLAKLRNCMIVCTHYFARASPQSPLKFRALRLRGYLVNLTISAIIKCPISDRCKFFDHEICSINLRKAILYQSKSLVKIIIRSHRIDFLKNPKALPTNQDKSSIVNMMDAFR